MTEMDRLLKVVSEIEHLVCEDEELIREALKALGHAMHVTEHNKVNCARCREAHSRIRAAAMKLEERLLNE